MRTQTSNYNIPRRVLNMGCLAPVLYRNVGMVMAVEVEVKDKKYKKKTRRNRRLVCSIDAYQGPSLHSPAIFIF